MFYLLGVDTLPKDDLSCTVSFFSGAWNEGENKKQPKKYIKTGPVSEKTAHQSKTGTSDKQASILFKFYIKYGE